MTERHTPDRSRGVFETLLAVDGEPVELEGHLDRLAGSLEALYSRKLPPQAENALREAASSLSPSPPPPGRPTENIRLGRLRLTAAPAEGGLQLDLLAGGVELEAVFPERGVRLRSHQIPGGLGAHKWADRRSINRPARGKPGALILDGGEALEAGWANLFAVRGGALFTPPLDGRLLPGTTRATVLQLAAQEGIEGTEAPLSPASLLTADETFLTGAIRGIEPALSLDGADLPGCGELSRRLAAALQRRWRLPENPAHKAAAADRRPGQPAR